MSIYDFAVQTIDKQDTTLEAYRDKVLLIVNTASACGLTPHYKGLQALYEQYKDQGLVVLGFPCNQFKEQEPGSEEEIKQFCELNYQVTFPLFAKIDVNGEHAHPLYKHLLTHTPEDSRTGVIDWNFAKFLVDRNGEVVRQYSARTEPEALADDIQALLA